MTGTGQSGSRAAAEATDGPPPRFWWSLVAVSISIASIGWATWEMAGAFPWGALGALIGSTIAQLWQTRRARERWPQQRAVDRALREHGDPGAAYRAAANQIARGRLARRTTAEIVVVTLIVGGPAVACVVMAAVRSDPTVALPAVPLTALAVWPGPAAEAGAREADRWLADPPFPRAGEERL
jgi:hypothetical protein